MYSAVNSLPRNVKVGHISYEMRQVATEEVLGSWGETNSITQVIEFDEDMSNDRAVEVVLHELMHGVWDAYKMDALVEEEEAVSGLAAGLAGIFKNNPRFKTWLIEALQNT